MTTCATCGRAFDRRAEQRVCDTCRRPEYAAQARRLLTLAGVLEEPAPTFLTDRDPGDEG